MGAYTWQDFHKQAKHNRNSPLFKLPAELRNEIFELALVEDSPISVNSMRVLSVNDQHWNGHASRIQDPGLLRTCRQARRECIKIFYGQNKFHIRVADFDLQPYIGFLRKHSAHGAAGSLEIRYAGAPDWDRLMMWLKMAYLKRCVAPCNGDYWSEDVQDSAIIAMFGTVEALGPGMSWEMVVKVLAPQRRVLGFADGRWYR